MVVRADADGLEPTVGLKVAGPDPALAARRARRRYVGRRLLYLPLTVFAVVTASFFLMNLLPGDVARGIAGPFGTPQVVQELRVRLGLDHPLGSRYLTYLHGIVHGDFGHSYMNGYPVSTDLVHRLPVTLELVIPSFLLAATLGVLIGVLSAYMRGRATDRGARWFSSFFQATPDYVVGLVLIYVVFFVLHVAPAPTGQLGLTSVAPPRRTGFTVVDAMLAGQWGTVSDALAHLALPLVTLTLAVIPVFVRMTRASMLTALSSDYVRFARANGLKERTVVGYALRDARSALLSYGALVLGSIIGGVPILELIFNWPGVGNWALQGILNMDLPVVLGFVVVVGTGIVVIYFLLDILTAYLDPRVKLVED